MPTLRQADFIGRDNLPDLLNKLGLRGDGVEVGTHRGDYAQTLLDRWSGGRLYCVDPWRNPPGYEDQAQYLSGGGNREEDYRVASRLLKGYGKRFRPLRKLSLEAVGDFENESLDFAYIDGDHSFEGVKADLDAWWPKIRPGGILAGHDFVTHSEGPDNWARFIQPAVMGFASLHLLDVFLIVEVQCLPWSYYMRKGWTV